MRGASVTGDYWSMWARCACCGHEGFRHASGYCGACEYLDHSSCSSEHRKIRRTR
jgi:hypothetical protein